MDQLRAWWNKLSRPQQLLIAVGVPAVAILALIASQRRDTAGDSDSDSPQPAAVIPAAPAPDPSTSSSAPGPGAADDLFNIAREIQGQFQATEEGLNRSVVETAAALQADAQAREDALEERLAATEEATAARQAELERQLARSQDDDAPRYDGREAVVARAYRDVLGREPDTGGLRFWAQSGYSSSEIRKRLEDSSEGKRLAS